MSKTQRWGILGLGNIAHKFASDLDDVKGAKLTAVASRSLEKAKDFASEFQVEYAFGSYKAMAESSEVDIIYIATPHVFHAEHSILCLNQGKAVLCEKPIAMNALQLRKVMKVARQQSLFLMEGLWTNFMPHLKKVHQLATDKTYGKCLKVEADFSFEANFDKEKRLFNKNLGGGALLDIGIYPVFLALKLLGRPKGIDASCKFSSTGVDESNKIKFSYDNGATAELSSSFAKTTPSKALVYFENATVEFGSSFHDTDKLEIKTESGSENLDYNYPSHAYQFEIEHVQNCLNDGLKESPEMPLQESLQLIETLDEIRQKMRLHYQEDKDPLSFLNDENS